MTNWKSRLYESYVSTKQAGSNVDASRGLSLKAYPSFCQLIRRHVPSNRSIRVADLACGHGSLIFCLKALGYKNVTGVDISTEQVELAHTLGIPEVEQGDIGTFLVQQNEPFDVIFMMDILEHLTRQELFDLLDAVYQALKPSGTLIIRTPNGDGLFGMGIRYGDLTHELCFTPKSIRQLLTAIGTFDIQVNEISPLMHGLKSFVRVILWKLLTIPPRLLYAAETGSTRSVLSRNLLAVAKKGS